MVGGRDVNKIPENGRKLGCNGWIRWCCVLSICCTIRMDRYISGEIGKCKFFPFFGCQQASGKTFEGREG